MIGSTVEGLGATETRPAFPGRLSLIGIVLGLALAAVSGARADLAVDFLATRAIVSVDGTSVGAFTASSTEYDFTGLQWMGDADTLAFFDDLVAPGMTSTTMTLSYPALDQPPATLTLPVGGAFYVQNGLADGTPGATQVAPLFFTGTVQTSTLSFTPSSTLTRFVVENTGTVMGGGTYSLNYSGNLEAAVGAASGTSTMTLALRLNNVDPSIYGGTNLTITGKASGVWSVPEPGSSAAVVIGLGVMLLKFGRGRGGLPV